MAASGAKRTLPIGFISLRCGTFPTESGAVACLECLHYMFDVPRTAPFLSKQKR
jgi:hypothetical protein